MSAPRPNPASSAQSPFFHPAAPHRATRQLGPHHWSSTWRSARSNPSPSGHGAGRSRLSRASGSQLRGAARFLSGALCCSRTEVAAASRPLPALHRRRTPGPPRLRNTLRARARSPARPAHSVHGALGALRSGEARSARHTPKPGALGALQARVACEPNPQTRPSRWSRPDPDRKRPSRATESVRVWREGEKE